MGPGSSSGGRIRAGGRKRGAPATAPKGAGKRLGAAAGPRAPSRKDARKQLDAMRALARRLVRKFPQTAQIIAPTGVDSLLKDDLSRNLLSALGITGAPLPEWGCPEGVDAYVDRLVRYAGTIADFRGCGAGELETPLSAGRWDEELIFELLEARTPDGAGPASPSLRPHRATPPPP